MFRRITFRSFQWRYLAIFLVFLVFVIGIVWGGLANYDLQKRRVHESWGQQVLGVNKLKVREIEAWLQERRHDGETSRQSVFLRSKLREFLRNPQDARLRQLFSERLSSLCPGDQYGGCYLLDTQGKPLVAVGVKMEGLTATEMSAFEEALRTGRPVLTEIHHDLSKENACLNVMVQIPSSDGPRKEHLAVMMFCCDLNRYLFPTIRAWPTPSPTAESVLVRRDGDQVLFLNKVRYRPSQPLSIRIPLSHPNLISAMVIHGEEGILEGVNYRGVRVLGAGQRIAGTSWFLVSQVDLDEIEASLRRDGRLTFLVILGFTTMVGMGLGWLASRHAARLQRRQMKAALAHRAMLDRYEQLMHFANDIIVICDSEGRIIEANEQACTAYGCSRGELRRMTMRDLRAPAFREDLPQYLQKLEKQRLVRHETRHIRKDGCEFPVEISSTFIETREGAFILGIIRDISEREKSQESLRRLTTAIHQVGEVIIITDREGIIEYVNPAFERVTGYSCEEAIGKTPRILKSGRHGEAFYKDVWQTITAGKVWSGRMVNKHKSGRLYEEDVIISPVKNAAGQAVNFVAVKRDVTRETALEEQFRQSQKMEAVGRLAGGVAHDFNNILMVIGGYVEMILNNLSENDPNTQRANEIRVATERAVALTSQLLAFSRKQVVQPKVLDLNQVLTEMEAMVGRLIGENIRFVRNYSHSLGRMKADPTQMQQVVMNLVVNARDAMLSKGGTLTIETHNVEIHQEMPSNHPGVPVGCYILLSVTDTGGGMSPEVQSHLFEPFFTTKSPGKGTGLGLSTVYGIVKQCSGHILVRSRVNEGATFTVLFPRCTESIAALQASAPKVLPVGKSETILLVEDERGVRRFARECLESHGYSVFEAEDGREALRICRESAHMVDLLLSDIVMPGMSGSDLAVQVQAFFPHVKVVLMSGYSEDRITSEILDEHDIVFMAKPFSANTLLETVQRVLDSRNLPPTGRPKDTGE